MSAYTATEMDRFYKSIQKATPAELNELRKAIFNEPAPIIAQSAWAHSNPLDVTVRTDTKSVQNGG